MSKLEELLTSKVQELKKENHELKRQISELDDEIVHYLSEIRRLQKLNEGLCERIAAQSEVIARNANKKKEKCDMGPWMKTNYVFGAPEKRLILPMRAKWGREFANELAAAKTEDPVIIENIVLQFIEQKRPDLKGCSIFFMEFDLRHVQWTFYISHPNFPKTQVDGMWAIEERMELCPKCNHPLSNEVQWFRSPADAIFHDASSIEVCSEECSK